MDLGSMTDSGASGSSTGYGAPARKVQQQPPRCQVEGCSVDLSDAKAYYGRHKVCAMHSKSSTVIVAGLQQRFCQQCSRFHQLPEFDQEKRSCRRRLAGHNERRRKPPPGSMLHSRHSRLYSTIFDNSSRTRGFLVDFSAYSRHNGRDAWQALRMSERGPTNQTTAAGGSIAIPSGECFNVADSTCALSLLSSQALELGVANAHGPPLAQLTAHRAADVHQYSNRNWGFRGSNEGGSSLHEMSPNLALGQITEPVNNQFSRELELSQQNAIENSRAYDSSTRGMHWSL